MKKQQPHITPTDHKKDRLSLNLLEREEKWKRYARNKGIRENYDHWTKQEWFWFIITMFILLSALGWVAGGLLVDLGLL